MMVRFEEDEYIAVAIFDAGNRVQTMEAMDEIFSYLDEDMKLLIFTTIQKLYYLSDEGYYVNKDTFIEIPDFMKVTSSESGGLTKDTVGYEIAGKDGTWEVIDYLLVEGKNYFLMEHEQYGKDVAYVVLDQKGNVLVDSTYNGFDDVVKQKILDSLHPPVQEQTEGYKPKLDNWQKYMENGEYLRSAEITEEANYNMIDGLKNNAAPKDKKNRQKESVLAKLNEKKEEIARLSEKKAMCEMLERNRK